MEAKAHRRSSEMGTPMPGKSDAGWGCWLKISASSALNKADRQGDEDLLFVDTAKWRDLAPAFGAMDDMDRSGGDG
jgi:hypothetical protein